LRGASESLGVENHRPDGRLSHRGGQSRNICAHDIFGSENFGGGALTQ